MGIDCITNLPIFRYTKFGSYHYKTQGQVIKTSPRISTTKVFYSVACQYSTVTIKSCPLFSNHSAKASIADVKSIHPAEPGFHPPWT